MHLCFLRRLKTYDVATFTIHKTHYMFKTLADIVLQKLNTYLTESQTGQGKVLIQNDPKKIADELQLEKLIRKGKINSENIEQWMENYLKNTQHMHHPHYMGHQVSVPHPAAALADFIHGLVNNPMAVYEMGPAAATIEKVIINWMLQKTGWFSAISITETDNSLIKGGGILTHGGSLANLTVMLAARAKVDPDAWTTGVSKDLVVFCPEVSHYSIARSISMMGMGSNAIIPIKVNTKEILQPDDLYPKFQKAKVDGKKIMAVVANACATSTGLYDPIEEVGQFCKENDLWFHIDGAHGAGALLSDKEKHLMKGIKTADSMIWDAHKMLRTSTLCAAALFKDHRNLDQTFHQKGSYIYFEKEKIGFDVISNSVECTKAGIGTKLFWVLAAEGEQGITDYIERQNNLAKDIYKLIITKNHFESPYVPESNILCFLYTKYGKENNFQLAIRNELVKRGDFYITSVIVNKQLYLRLVLMNPKTEISHIKALYKEIESIAKYLKKTN